MVGKEGKITQRAALTGATGGWATSLDAFNSLIADLVQPTTETARVFGAVAKGDLAIARLWVRGTRKKGDS